MNLNLSKTLFYTYWLGPETLGVILAKDKFKDICVLSRVHGFDLYEERHIPHYIPFRQVILNKIDKIFAVSKHGIDYLGTRYIVDRDKLRISRLGVNDPGFNTAYSKDGLFRIVSCSFLVPVKRINLLMCGIKVFSERHPGVHVVWNHLGDGPQRARIESKAKEIMPASVDYYFRGMLTNNEVLKFYKNHPIDVFANVSESEGIPVSIMEAQSCGIPVIATAVGGTPEIVDNKNGALLSFNPTATEVAESLEKFAFSCDDSLAKRKLSKDSWYLNYNGQINYNRFCEELLTL
jgi:glycosyltransferase involved in cell wall biosynthesis